MRVTYVLIMLQVLYFVACSGGSGSPDSGGQDAADGADGQGDKAADRGQEEAFFLEVPDATRLCSMYSVDETSLADVKTEYRIKASVWLRPGRLVLDKEKQSFEADWIERVVFGPEQREAVVQGQGTFRRTIQGTVENGVYRYEYDQLFDLDGQPYRLSFTADYEVSDGQAARPVITLDDETLSTPISYLDPAEFMMKGVYGKIANEQIRYLAGCSFQPACGEGGDESKTRQEVESLVAEACKSARPVFALHFSSQQPVKKRLEMWWRDSAKRMNDLTTVRSSHLV